MPSLCPQSTTSLPMPPIDGADSRASSAHDANGSVIMHSAGVAHVSMKRYWVRGVCWGLVTFALAFGLRMLEWPCWQNPEYRLGSEWLLATHDAYTWVAGAEGFGLAVGHPMAVMLQWMALAVGVPPATVAFWFPPVLASCVAVIVYAWVWAFGSMETGVAAGVLVSLSPGFLGRTLLGFYDTDLVTLFFPLLMTFAPACWAMRYMLLPGMVLRRLAKSSGVMAARHLLFHSSQMGSSSRANICA